MPSRRPNAPRLVLFTLLGLAALASPASGQGGWTSLTLPDVVAPIETMRAVYFANAMEGWAVGYNGNIIHTVNGGTSWTSQRCCDANLRFLAVRFVDANNGWAGAGRLILRTTDGGTTWVDVLADTSVFKFRNSLFPVSATQAWAPAGSSGVPTPTRWFSRYTVQGDGTVTEQDYDVIASSAPFLDMFFTDADNGWAVNGSGQIRRISNASGTPSFGFQTSGVSTSLNGIFMLDATHGWIVGNGGKILKTTDGSTWTALTSGTTTNLRDVHFIDLNRGWVVGEGGLIRSTTDGGANWTAETSGVTTTLWSVSFAGVAAGFAAGGDLATSGNGVVLKTPPATTGLVTDGWFTNGLASWQQYATPDSSYIVASVTNGVLEYYRVPPPPGESNQAVVLQNTGQPLDANAALEVYFDVGNSSSVRKRISVLIHESDFSDLSVCTFWLAPGAPLATYGMRTHSTKAWTNASVSFYAASPGSDGGAYRLDNVVVQYAPAQATTRTDCLDPTAPAPPGGGDGPELLTNGDFGTGTTAGWSLYGQITQQVAGGVFEFYRPAATPDPAGVILQPTGTALAAGEIVTAQFHLGNSSAVRKRVTVILHDLDFSDLSACTFWLAPGQALSPYAMRSFTTEAWGNLTLSIYAATVGDDQWMRLDDVSLRQTPGASTTGADCVEPGGALPAAAGASQVSPTSLRLPTPIFERAPARRQPSRGANARRPAPPVRHAPPAPARTTNAAASLERVAVAAPPAEVAPSPFVSSMQQVDLRDVADARLQIWSRFAGGAQPAVVQVSVDGQNWLTLAAVFAIDEPILLDIDLSRFAGQVVWIRFMFPG